MSVTHEPGPDVDQLAHAVIGAAIEVHRQLGPGFLENVYEEALCHELRSRSIPFERQKVIDVHYKGKRVGRGRLDLMICNALLVELKATEAVPEIDLARVLSYLKATSRQLALVINFNVTLLKHGLQRVVRTTAST